MAGRLYTFESTEFNPTASMAYWSIMAAAERPIVLKEFWLRCATIVSSTFEVLLQRITAASGTFTQTLTARPVDARDAVAGATIKAQNTATAPTVDATDVLEIRHHVNSLVGIHIKFADWMDDNGIWIKGNTGKGLELFVVDDPDLNVLVGGVIKEYG